MQKKDTEAVRRSEISKTDDHKLVKRCQSGDRNAYHEIYKRYAAMLYSVAFRMLGRREDAEDAMQNTFVKLQRHIGQFQFKAKFSTYLVRILINACHDINQQRNGLLQIYDNLEITHESHSDWNLTLEKAIRMLPLKMRECFILYAVEGFKQKEIAEMLETSEGTVKAHIFQAKAKLRETLQSTI